MDRNHKRLQRYYEKRDAFETLPAEYERPLRLKVEQKQRKFNWRSLIMQFVP